MFNYAERQSFISNKLLVYICNVNCNLNNLGQETNINFKLKDHVLKNFKKSFFLYGLSIIFSLIYGFYEIWSL
jgi:hypothetical protein